MVPSPPWPSAQPDSSGSDPALPKGFHKIDTLLAAAPGLKANVIGLVEDFQQPIPTKGDDYKCTIRIVDTTCQDQGTKRGIEVVFFWRPEKMPVIRSKGDVVVIRDIKVQMRMGYNQLLANHGTQVISLQAGKIAPWPASTYSGNMLKPAIQGPSHALLVPEIKYVLWLASSISDAELPSNLEFQGAALQSANTRDKFSLMKDLQVDKFYNVLGEVIRIHSSSDRTTVYLSDYTANSQFYDNKSESEHDYGYVNNKSAKENDWPGPFGKMSLQVTAFDYHAERFKDSVKVGDWVEVKNIYTRYGGNLEARLSADRYAFEGKKQIELLKHEEGAAVDERWKAALRRHRDYWKNLKSGKRPIDEESEQKSNGRKRRREKLVAATRPSAIVEESEPEDLNLNANIKCIHRDKRVTALSDILKFQHVDDLSMPFLEAKYRANIRVVDYFPHDIKSFAVGRRPTIYSMLSDDEGGESTDTEAATKGKRSSEARKWSWRFSLKVQDASHDSDASRLAWVEVDDESAQYLLNLDADSPIRNPRLVEELREKLFRLWGNLEEQKSNFLESPNGKALLHAIYANSCQACNGDFDTDSSSTNAQVDRPKPNVGRKATDSEEQLPPDSDDDVAQPQMMPTRQTEKTLGEIRQMDGEAAIKHLESSILSLEVRNRGFAACIEQYGVEWEDGDNGMDWQRIFALFGTKIC